MLLQPNQNTLAAIAATVFHLSHSYMRRLCIVLYKAAQRLVHFAPQRNPLLLLKKYMSVLTLCLAALNIQAQLAQQAGNTLARAVLQKPVAA